MEKKFVKHSGRGKKKDSLFVNRFMPGCSSVVKGLSGWAYFSKNKKNELFSNWNHLLFHYVRVEFKVWLKLKRKAKRKKHGNNFCQNALK